MSHFLLPRHVADLCKSAVPRDGLLARVAAVYSSGLSFGDVAVMCNGLYCKLVMIVDAFSKYHHVYDGVVTCAQREWLSPVSEKCGLAYPETIDDFAEAAKSCEVQDGA